MKTIAAADEKGLPPLQHKSQHLTSRLAKTARNAKQRSQDIVEEVKEVLQERPKQIMTAAVGGFKVLSSVDFSPAIQKQIQDAIARGNKARRVIKPENEIKQAVHYMNAQVTPHLKAIDKLLLGQSPDRDHLIILNFAHVQQKMGDYLAAHFFKHGIVSHLPQVVRDFMKVFNDNIHNLIGSNLQSSTALSQAK
ncbi:hypothetical protein KBC03_03135 [Patescibacteria group bacterium]|nr:hypothetical protein [Patescibacteria group bacterium]